MIAMMSPISVGRRGAAEAFGVSASQWDELVRTGWAPKPYRLKNGYPRWDYALLAWWSRYCQEHGGTRWSDCEPVYDDEMRRLQSRR